MKLDRRAVYNERTETITTGDGQYIVVRELYKALTTLNIIYLDKIIRRLGLHDGVSDPFEAPQQHVVADMVDICRSLPQYCLPIIGAALDFGRAGAPFEGLVRDSRFGGADAYARAAWYERDSSPAFDDKIANYFYKTRTQEGEFQYFIRGDQKAAMLPPGARFEDLQPYADCFLVMRTAMGHYFLRWPTEYPEIPAFYLDERDRAVPFYPSTEIDASVDFVELFPNYTYEVFGVQFSLPDIGTDYSYHVGDHDLYDEEPEGEEPEWTDEQPALGTADRIHELFVILEAEHLEIADQKALSRHFRKLSVKYHPLKHLHASDEEKLEIHERYVVMTTAYNELKDYLPRG